MKRIPLTSAVIALVVCFATPTVALANSTPVTKIAVKPPVVHLHKAKPHKRHVWQRGGHAVVVQPSHASRMFKALRLALARQGGMAYSQSGSRGYLPMSTVPPATDCSGFATWALRMAGIDAPLSTSYSFMYQGRSVPISQRYLKIGDLIIYNGHVAVYFGGGMTYGHGTPGIHVNRWDYRPVIGVRRFFNR
jgi:cell wall-associated NlpC family hydrolase